MTRRRPFAPRAAAVLLLALVAACTDGPTAPDTSAFNPRVGWHKDGGGDPGTSDVIVTTFEYRPNTPLVARIGGEHSIAFSPWSVCDPATAGYGAGLWDAPCRPATGPITIIARSWRDAHGHPQIKFSPALRFAPDRPVTLYLRDREAARDPSYLIAYCGEGGECVDESLGDPTLATHRNLASGVIWRRIKHFSSYNVAAEREL